MGWNNFEMSRVSEITPENKVSQKEISLPTIHFRVRTVSFREGRVSYNLSETHLFSAMKQEAPFTDYLQGPPCIFGHVLELFHPTDNWYKGPPCRDEFVKSRWLLEPPKTSASSRKVSLQFETNRNMSLSHWIPCMIYLPIHLVDLYGRMVDVGKYAIHGCYGYP